MTPMPLYHIPLHNQPPINIAKLIVKSATILALLVLALLCSAQPCQAQSKNERSRLKNERSRQERLFGVTKPRLLADLSPMTAGQIAKVHVAEGDHVKKDQLLVSLDDRFPLAALDIAKAEAEQVAQIDTARVTLRQVTNHYNRLLKAFQSNASSSFELDSAKAEVEKAEAQLRYALEQQKTALATVRLREAELATYHIRAPFDGVVVQLHSKLGTMVDGSIPTITIADLSTLEVEIFVSVRLIGKIKQGSDVVCTARAPVNSDLKGEVLSASPLINAAGETFRTLISLPNPDNLPAGFGLEIKLDE